MATSQPPVDEAADEMMERLVAMSRAADDLESRNEAFPPGG
jgi:hypothetical protein